MSQPELISEESLERLWGVWRDSPKTVVSHAHPYLEDDRAIASHEAALAEAFDAGARASLKELNITLVAEINNAAKCHSDGTPKDWEVLCPWLDSGRCLDNCQLATGGAVLVRRGSK